MRNTCDLYTLILYTCRIAFPLVYTLQALHIRSVYMLVCSHELKLGSINM
jgi:hypothetical protein